MLCAAPFLSTFLTNQFTSGRSFQAKPSQANVLRRGSSEPAARQAPTGPAREPLAARVRVDSRRAAASGPEPV